MRSDVVKWIRDRLVEPSTWRGLLLLVGFVKWKYSPEQVDGIASTVAPLIAALWIGEKKPSTTSL